MSLTTSQQQMDNASQHMNDDHNRGIFIRQHEERWSSVIRLMIAGLLVFALVFVVIDSLGNRHIESIIISFLTWVELHPHQGILAVIGVYILATILFVPGSILTLGAAYAFGSAYQNKVHGVIVASMVSVPTFSIVKYRCFPHLLYQPRQSLLVHLWDRYALFFWEDIYFGAVFFAWHLPIRCSRLLTVVSCVLYCSILHDFLPI